MSGLTMLMSIGYELRIDTIKNHIELPKSLDIHSLLFKIYHSISKVQRHYSSDDYFALGFMLGINIEEILENYEK